MSGKDFLQYSKSGIFDMILRRLGNKKKIAVDIIKHFPRHTTYVEPFFGAGGMFFSKPKAKYNLVNDQDSEVFNLFMVLKEQKEGLYESLYQMPINEELWCHWKINKESDPLLKAIRFLFLSNFGYMGKPNTLRFANGSGKKILLDSVKETHRLIFDVEFMNVDFRKVFDKIPVEDLNNKTTFIYCDPPYLGTDDNYENSFTEIDSLDLFNKLTEIKCKYAMSEFAHPFILNQAKERGLFINIIGERRSMKNRSTEILITNYLSELKLF